VLIDLLQTDVIGAPWGTDELVVLIRQVKHKCQGMTKYAKIIFFGGGGLVLLCDISCMHLRISHCLRLYIEFLLSVKINVYWQMIGLCYNYLSFVTLQIVSKDGVVQLTVIALTQSIRLIDLA